MRSIPRTVILTIVSVLLTVNILSGSCVEIKSRLRHSLGFNQQAPSGLEMMQIAPAPKERSQTRAMSAAAV